MKSYKLLAISVVSILFFSLQGIASAGQSYDNGNLNVTGCNTPTQESDGAWGFFCTEGDIIFINYNNNTIKENRSLQQSIDIVFSSGYHARLACNSKDPWQHEAEWNLIPSPSHRTITCQ